MKAARRCICRAGPSFPGIDSIGSPRLLPAPAGRRLGLRRDGAGLVHHHRLRGDDLSVEQRHVAAFQQEDEDGAGDDTADMAGP